MLWLAIYLPGLALEIHTRGAIATAPLAVTEIRGATERILTCNAPAQACGVGPDMTTSSAWALCANLQTVTRDPVAERHALEHIAAWSGQFTSQISIAGTTELLLEIDGSLQLLGSPDAIRSAVENGIRELGYNAHLACAPTPLAAQWLARAGMTTIIRELVALRRTLDDLPVHLLPAPMVAMLERFGIETLGACLQLPRDGLARRIGQELLDMLDRALGLLPDPRLFFVPPRMFAGTVALPAPTEHAEGLLFAAHRLCIELCGHLRATGNGAQRLDFTLRHEHRQRTRFAIMLIAASRDPEHLLMLLRERLTQIKLPQPVLAIRLACPQQQPLASENNALFPDARTQADMAARLIEKLRTRLGNDAITGLRLFADHRPEQAWRVCAPAVSAPPFEICVAGERPLWLLPRPQMLREHHHMPQHDGPLTLLAGPERIESGWWDGYPVARDYFVAATPAQAVLWIYRERGISTRWFLQGLFA